MKRSHFNSILTKLYETSLLLPGLIDVNIDGVAEELQGRSNRS